MDPRTSKFIAFAAFSVASLVGGYLCRKRGWVKQEFSRRLHFHTVVWVWSAAALLALWQRALVPQDLWLVGFQVVILAVTCFATIPLARLFHCTRAQVGVLAVAASVGNLGFTLGAYLCYSVLRPPDEALALGVLYVTIMQAVGVVIVYPVARHFGQARQGDQSLGRLMLANFTDARSLLFWGAVAGAALAWCRVPMPGWVRHGPLLDVVFYLGSFGGYFGIGLCLHLGPTWRDLKAHAILAAVRFGAIPLLTAAMIGALRLAGVPPLDRTVCQVVMVEAFMPTAIWTVMLANLFHLDVRLAGSLWLWNTILFFAVPMGFIFVFYH
jgi:predicted permease